MIPLTFLGTQLPSSLIIPVPEGCVGVAVYNSSPIQYAIGAQPIQASTAATQINVAAGFSQGVPFADARTIYLFNANGASPAAGNILNLYIYTTGEEATFPGPFVAPFGVSVYGAGGPGATLYDVFSGSQINFGDVEQLIELWTARLPAENPRLANSQFLSFLDSGGTARPVLTIDAVNSTQIRKGSAAGLFTFFNFAGTVAVVVIDDLGNMQLGRATELSFGDANHGWQSQPGGAGTNVERLRAFNSGAGTGWQFWDSNAAVQRAFLDALSGVFAAAGLQAGTQAPPANGLGVQGRITAPAVGAAGTTLRHTADVSPAGLTTLTGTGPVTIATATALTGVPTTARRAGIIIQQQNAGILSCGPSSTDLAYTPGTTNLSVFVDTGLDGGGQLWYTVAAGGGVNWTITIKAVSYEEAT